MASEKFLRLHLKVMQIGRKGWVMVSQLAVGAHDLCPPPQKQRILAYYPVHYKASEKIQFSIPQKLITAFTIYGVYQTKPNYTPIHVQDTSFAA